MNKSTFELKQTDTPTSSELLICMHTTENLPISNIFQVIVGIGLKMCEMKCVKKEFYQIQSVQFKQDGIFV